MHAAVQHHTRFALRASSAACVHTNTHAASPHLPVCPRLIFTMVVALLTAVLDPLNTAFVDAAGL